MKLLKNSNLGLKLLALILALIVYYSLKNETPSSKGHDRSIFQSR